MCFKLKKRSANHLFFFLVGALKGCELPSWISCSYEWAICSGHVRAPQRMHGLGKTGRGSLRHRNPRSKKICGFILPWILVYNHWGFLGQSSEDTWALIKMSFMHFAKSLRSTRIATVITAILLFPELTASLAQKSPNIRRGPLKALPSVTRMWWLRVVFTALLINSPTGTEQISSLGFNKPPFALQASRCRRWLLIYLWLRALDVECIIRTLFQWEASSKARGSGVIFGRDNVEQSRLIGNDGVKKKQRAFERFGSKCW